MVIGMEIGKMNVAWSVDEGVYGRSFQWGCQFKVGVAGGEPAD